MNPSNTTRAWQRTRSSQPKPVRFLESDSTRYALLKFDLFALRKIVHVGECNDVWKELFRQYKVRSVGFITAYCPYGLSLSHGQNNARRYWLERSIGENWTSITAVLRDAELDYPGEPGLLVPGIGLRQAQLLAHQFGQPKLIHVGADAVAKLYLIDD